MARRGRTAGRVGEPARALGGGTRRALVARSALVAVSSPLAMACGPLRGAGVSDASREPVRISFMSDWAGGARLKTIEDSLTLWQQQQPTISVEFRPTDSVQVKVTADLAAGTAADVVMWGGNELDNYVDLMPFVKRDKVDMKQFLFVDPFFLHQGGQYAMPFQYNMEGTYFYNRDLFQREGVAPPTAQWTWNELAEAGLRLTRPDQRQWGLQSYLNSDFEVMVRSLGADLISQDMKRTTLNTPQAREAAQWLVDRIQRDRSLVRGGAVPEVRDLLQQGQSQAFQAGRAGIMSLNAGWVGVLESTIGFGNFVWDVMPTPVAPGTGKATPLLGDHPHTMTKRPGRTAAQADAAWRFILFMSGPDVMEFVAEGRTSIPVHKKALNGARYLRQPPESVTLIPRLVESASFRRQFKHWGEWRSAIFAELEGAWTGAMGVSAALENATRVGDGLLRSWGVQ